jgi:BlaI family transcriptional regulator, penicillinase repressor
MQVLFAKNTAFELTAARAPFIFTAVSARHHEHDPLSRRERQIMDVIWRAGRASATEIHGQLPDAPSYSAVRALLAVLVNKGHLRHERDGKRYVYEPLASQEKAGKSALRRLLSTFFNNSPADLVATLLDPRELDSDELARIKSLLAKKKKK